jgi:hypothetical protein
MISDFLLRARTTPFLRTTPIGAFPLPGLLSILRRPTPGGGPMPTIAEAVTPMKRTDYTGRFPTGNRIIPTVIHPVQGHAYATNPRKDGSRPKIPAALDSGTTRQVANEPKAFEMARRMANSNPSTSGNNTGRVSDSFDMAQRMAASNPAAGPSDSFHWAALLVIAGIAFFVFKR